MDADRSFKSRHSPYCFNPIELPKVLLDPAFEAARWAPSPFNSQPWRFLCFERRHHLFDALIQSCAPRNQMWAQNASFLVACCAQSPHRQGLHSSSRSIYAKYDDMIEYSVGLCVGLFLAELTKSTLQAHIMRGFDVEQVHKMLGLPQTMTILTIIAIGQEIDDNHPAFAHFDEVLQKRMEVKRVRKPLNDVVSWNKSWTEENK